MQRLERNANSLEKHAGECGGKRGYYPETGHVQDYMGIEDYHDIEHCRTGLGRERGRSGRGRGRERGRGRQIGRWRGREPGPTSKAKGGGKYL